MACLPRHAHAYSSFGDYVRPIAEGGGGGKLFTGTPADGYTCDVCHSGAESSSLHVSGLPAAGYTPGQTYELTFQWADSLRVALMAELTDPSGAPAGVTALAPYATWTTTERCAEDDFPAADICRTGAEPGCCRDLDPTRDGCSFPGERSVFWMLECGARSARLQWTAPSSGDVWFSATMLTSNAGNDALGDGVTLVRQRLHPASDSGIRSGATGSCQLQRIHGSHSGEAAWALLSGMAALAFRRARRRQRQQLTACTGRPHTS